MKKLLRLALLAGAAVGISKVVQSQKAQWSGMTEAEVRDKLHSAMATRLPEDKLNEIQDKIVGEMKSRGMLAEEPVDATGNGGIANEVDGTVLTDTD